MSLRSILRSWLGVSEFVPPAPAPEKQPMKIRDDVLAEFGPSELKPPAGPPFRPPELAPGVLPNGRKLAMDSATTAVYQWANGINSLFTDGVQFMGYPYLAELTQRAEYRRPSEIIARNMTRKWMKLQVTGEENKQAKLEAIEAEFKRLDVQGIFRRAVEMDGYFGRSQVYIDLGVSLEDRDEIKTPVTMTKAKVAKGSLKRLTLVEPMWTYPNNYNSTDPLKDDYYKPTSWFVMGADVHASRLLTIVGRPVPDILKPAYAFGGISLSQMGKPYVDNWLRTRQSVSDIIHSFTVFVLATDMGTVLNGGAATELRKRAILFNKLRDNRGLFVRDKDTEEFENVSAPLSSLDSLQAQTQEHMSAVFGIPLSVLLGITPSGLNASNEGEIRTFYDWVESQQEAMLTAPLKTVLDVVQLSLFGEIDPAITFAWNPLWTMSDKERADIGKSEAETDALYLDMGAIDSEEVRHRIATAEDSPYAGLDLSKEIVPPDANEEDDIASIVKGATAEAGEVRVQ